MDDADDDHHVIVNRIENPVLTEDKAANALAEFGLCRACQRVTPQQRKSVFEAARIVVGDILSKCLRAIFIDINKVSACSRTDIQISHDACGVPQ